MRLSFVAAIAVLAIAACTDSSDQGSVMDAEASAEAGAEASLEGSASVEAGTSTDSAAVADSSALEATAAPAHCCVLTAPDASASGARDGAPSDATASSTGADSDSPSEAGAATCGPAGMPFGGQVTEPCLNSNAAGGYGRWTCSSGSCANNGLSCVVGDTCTLVDVGCTGVVQACDYPWAP